MAACGAPGAAAKDKAIKRPAADVTGAINASASGLADSSPSPAVMRTAEALERFGAARAAMEHGLLLREAAPKSDIASIQTNTKKLLDDIAAVEQMDQTHYADSAKDARRLVDDWYQAGMKILAPPAGGLTELPLPMLVSTKAEAAVTALEWLAAEAAANTTAPAAVAVAASSPVKVSPPVTVPAPSSAATLAPHQASRKTMPAHPAKQMTQNEASLQLLHDGLPLFIPPAALFMQEPEAAK
jgi:hypothetical protein